MGFTPEVQRFIDRYVDGERDPVRCGALARMKNPNRGKGLLKRLDVKAEIDRRLAIVDAEKAKITAEKEHITIEFLDQELKKIILLDEKEHGTVKLAATKFGYERAGAIRDGDFITPTEYMPVPATVGGGEGEESQSATQHRGAFRASDVVEERITERTITRTVEAVGETKHMEKKRTAPRAVKQEPQTPEEDTGNTKVWPWRYGDKAK